MDIFTSCWPPFVTLALSFTGPLCIATICGFSLYKAVGVGGPLQIYQLHKWQGTSHICNIFANVRFFTSPLTKFNPNNFTSSKILFFHIIGLSGLEEEPEVPEVKIHVSNVDGERRHLRLLAPTRRLGACAVLCRGTREDQGCISKSAQIVLNIFSGP